MNRREQQTNRRYLRSWIYANELHPPNRGDRRSERARAGCVLHMRRLSRLAHWNDGPGYLRPEYWGRFVVRPRHPHLLGTGTGCPR